MIQISKDLYMDAEPTQFILIQWDGKYRYDKSKKQEVMTRNSRWYFNNFESLVNKVLVTLMRENVAEAQTLEELKTLYTETKEIIRSFVASMTPDICKHQV